MPLKAHHKHLAVSCCLLLTISLFLSVSCSQETGSSYEESYIEFRLDPASPLQYDDLQSIKVYVDPYGAFNLLSMHDNGRSVLGAYDYNAESKIYMGFEYSSLYPSRLENLSIVLTLKESQAFIDSADYTLSFFGEMPEASRDKPYVQISVSGGDPGVISLAPVQGAAGSPLLQIR